MRVNLTNFGNVTRDLQSLFRHSGLKHAGMTNGGRKPMLGQASETHAGQ
jgi:hypothetical protein